MSEGPPYVGAMVHFVTGDLHCAAVITHLDYRTSVPPEEVSIAPLMAVPPEQALLVLTAMQQPFWAKAGYSAGMEVGTWHWPSAHEPPIDPAPEPKPPMFVGMIVHYAKQPITHFPAIVCAIYEATGRLDLAYLDTSKGKPDWYFAPAVPYDVERGSNTWHRISMEPMIEPYS